MDPENVGKETIVKVRGWLRGIWEMRRRTGPVQQWVDSLPSPIAPSSPIKIIEVNDMNNLTIKEAFIPPIQEQTLKKELNRPIMTASMPITVPNSPSITMTGVSNCIPHHRLIRDQSLQSDSSHCSSVESLLELRKADPEAVLLSLGFGGCSNSPQENGPLSRIPKRFLQPSKLKGIAITDFVKQQQETNESLDTASLGYRGLTGSPYVAPSEIVQKIMERLREHESHELEIHTSCNVSFEQSPQEGRLSVLSPDNRLFLDQPRSKSPDMRNKRMIIGQKSFAFGCDGDLIEIDSSQKRDSRTNIDSTTSSTNQSKLNTIDVMKTGPSYETFINLQTHSSFQDNMHVIKHDCSSSREPFTINVSNLSDSLKIQNIEKRKELIETMHEKLNSKHQVDDNHNLHNILSKSNECLPENLQKAFTFEELERISDEITQFDQSCKIVVSNRRKSLKRQAKIRDEQFGSFDLTDTTEKDKFSDSIRDGVLHKESIPVKMNSPSNHLQLVTNIRDRVCEKVSEMEETLNMELDEVQDSESEDSTSGIVNENDFGEEKDRNNRCCLENRDLCCQSDKLGQICKHDENHTGCCYHESSEQCWRKMEKIIEKNKKLEKMVVKSKKGMVEIRDMLSSVLSVRMEPGF